MTPSLEKSTILDALRRVIDPAFEKDIVTLGFVKDVSIRETEVMVEMEWSTPAFPGQKKLKSAIDEQVRGAGATRVDIREKSIIQGHRAKDKEQLLSGVKNVVAVASGKGGVGKSTISANLALALARSGASVGLLDADVYGPSMGLMLNVNAKPEVRQTTGEQYVMKPVDAYGIKVMSMAFLASDDMPVIWRGPMVHGLIQQFLTQVEWGDLDYLVIDLPPGTGDAQLTLTQTAPLSGAIIVTTPQEVSLIDARKGLKMFEQVKVPVLGIVENMSGFACPHCNEISNIFSSGGGKSASDDLGVPYLGSVPIDPSVVLGGDEGKPVIVRNPESPAAAACLAISEKVAVRLAQLAAAPTPEGDFFVDWEA